MNHAHVETLDASKTWWVPSVTAPARNWPGAPGCRRGARFLIDQASLRPARNNYPCFANRALCLEWIMAHRAHLSRTLPGVRIRAVPLARWLLGLE